MLLKQMEHCGLGGYNTYGQLGQNNTISRSSPIQIGSETNWSYVAGYGYTVAAVKTDGTLWTWGINNTGQLGLNITTPTNKSSPTQVGALTNWLTVGAKEYAVAAVKTDGTLWTWGENIYGKLGHNNTTYLSSPVQVGALTTWESAEAGGSSTNAIKTDGTLWVWGRNNQGQLAQNNTIDVSSPVQVGADTDWSSANATNNASSFCIAKKTDNTLWVWGRGLNGQLGLGDAVNKSSPVQLGSKTTWGKVALAEVFTLAIEKQ
jgi:alpha-tubulin suppressor-like RCC1 family protein